MKRTYAFLSISLISLLATLSLSGCDQLMPANAQNPVETPVVMANADTSLVVEGQIEPRDDARLTFAVAGEVAEVLVEEGQTVAKGDVLARLGDRESYQAQVTAAELELATAQQQYDELTENTSLASSQAVLDMITAQRALTDAQENLEEIDTDAYQDKIDEARTRVSDAENELEDAQEEFDKYQELADDHPNRERAENALKDAQEKYDQAARERDRLIYDLEQARAEVEMSAARLEEAVRNRDERQNGPDPDDLNLVLKRLDNAQAQLTAANAAVDSLDLVAPFSGTIVNVDASPGELVSTTQVVFVIVDFSEWYVETNDLTEYEVVLIDIDRKATIVPDALPELKLTGRVVSINNDYTERAGDVIYETRILLEQADPRLRWGMKVEVRFTDD